MAGAAWIMLAVVQMLSLSVGVMMTAFKQHCRFEDGKRALPADVAA